MLKFITILHFTKLVANSYEFVQFNLYVFIQSADAPLTVRAVDLNLKLHYVTFGALAVNKQNCMHLAEENCSLFMYTAMQVLGYSIAAVIPTGLK